MPRTLTIKYPDGQREFWLTDQVFVPGDLLERGDGSWFVVSVDDPNQAGKHTTVLVRPGGRTVNGRVTPMNECQRVTELDGNLPGKSPRPNPGARQ